MHGTNDKVVIVGVTTSTDAAALAAFREKSGANYPILMGLTEESKAAYGITGFPALRVLAADGSVAGSDEAAVTKCLEAK